MSDAKTWAEESLRKRYEGELHEKDKVWERRVYALAQLMLSLNGTDMSKVYDASGSDSQVMSNELVRLASEFADEWAKVPNSVHDELGEDYIEEIDNLSDWVVAHAKDVMENELEYGGYSAGRVGWAVVSEDVEDREGDHPDKVIWSELVAVDADNEADARARMMDIAFASLRDYVDDKFNGDTTYTLKQNYKGDVEMRKCERGTVATYRTTALKRWRLDKRRVPLKESK